MQITRRGVLAGSLALGVTVPAWAREVRRPARRPVSLSGSLRTEDLLAAIPAGAATGYVVLDMRTGAVLDALGETQWLPPASVQKSITTLFALERLGARRQLPTRVLGAGVLSAGVLRGDLILQGGGDPTLDTDGLGDLVASLARKGLRRITGRFLVDASALPALQRIAADQPEQAGYNPGLAGLQLNFNRVNFEWGKGASALAMNARGERYLAPVHVATMAAVNRDSPLFARTDRDGIEAWSVAAPALRKDGSRWLPVRHVGAYVADVFRGLCAAQGITLPDPEMTDRVAGASVLAERQSPALDVILKGMLKYSTNVTAETLGLMASGAADLAASAAAMGHWAEAHLGLHARFVDHSGLGSEARVTPLGLARAQRAGDATPSGAALRGLLKSGGLKDDAGEALPGDPVTIRVKSGTLNFVSGLAGFIEVKGGRDLVFAIQTADLQRRAALPMESRENPPGLRNWLGLTRRLQGGLIRRWADEFGKVEL